MAMGDRVARVERRTTGRFLPPLLGVRHYVAASAAVSIAATVASAGIAAYGAVQSAHAQSAAAAYQAQVAKNNATEAQQNATYAIQAGETSAETQGLKNKEALGAVVASEAANNVDVNSGSALDVQVGQRETGLEDVDQIRSNALLNAYGYQTQATSFTAQSTLDTSTAANDTSQIPVLAGSDLLSGAASGGNAYVRALQVGAIPGGTTASGGGNLNSNTDTTF